MGLARSLAGPLLSALKPALLGGWGGVEGFTVQQTNLVTSSPTPETYLLLWTRVTPTHGVNKMKLALLVGSIS